MMRFTVVQTEGGEVWDREVTRLGGSPLISAGWLEALRSPHRHPVYLELQGETGATGLAGSLVLEPTSALLRPYGRRLFLYTGPALPDHDHIAVTAAVEGIVEFARRQGLARVVVRSWDYPRAFDFPRSLRHRSRRKEFVLDLSGDTSEIEARMRPQVHRQVRQAVRTGLTFQEERQDAVIDQLLALLEQTKAIRLAKGHDDYDYFYLPHLGRDALLQMLRSGFARAFVVRGKGGDCLSVAVVLVHGRRAVALLIGTAAEGYRLKAPSLMWWEAARHLKAAGVTSLSMLGVPSTPDGKALEFFKLSLGCQKFPCADGATGLLQRSPMHLLARLWSGQWIGWT